MYFSLLYISLKSWLFLFYLKLINIQHTIAKFSLYSKPDRLSSPVFSKKSKSTKKTRLFKGKRKYEDICLSKNSNMTSPTSFLVAKISLTNPIFETCRKNYHKIYRTSSKSIILHKQKS